MTEIESTVPGIRDRAATARAAGRRVALVPTMGALHAGHLALVARARERADLVVVSLFVNPLQFGPDEDLDRYPRDLPVDLAALDAAGADLLFAPPPEALLPEGRTRVSVAAGTLGALYEGSVRPGHFDGVLTIVAKLLHVVGPDVVVFGQKDAQQVFLVRTMIRDLDFPVALEVVDTVREADGLARSSRNRYLDADGRALAATIPAALTAAESAAARGPGAVLGAARAVLSGADGVPLDYLVLVDPETFLPVDDGYRGPALVLVAARVGSTRLIDNRRVHLG